jgi:hypothetical protein
MQYIISTLSMTKTVYDPFGDAIILSSNLVELVNIPNSTLKIDAGLVITHPAMMFETTDGSFEKYYLRTIEWDNLVMVKAKRKGEAFITDHYVLNPPIERILELIKKCRQTK